MIKKGQYKGYHFMLIFRGFGKSGRRHNRQSAKIGAADIIGSRPKSASDRRSVGVAMKIFCRIGSRSANSIFFAEIATLLHSLLLRREIRLFGLLLASQTESKSYELESST